MFAAAYRAAIVLERSPTYSPALFLTILWGMLLWRDDFSTLSLEEVLRYQIENRAWSKELRFRSSALVNSRLANEISQDDYLANRKLARQDAKECQRRAAILDSFNHPLHRQTAASCKLNPLLALRAAPIPAILESPRSESFVVIATVGRSSSFKVEQAPFMRDKSYELRAGVSA